MKLNCKNGKISRALIVALICADAMGCAQNHVQEHSTSAPPADKAAALSLIGPGGSVSIGDNLDAAKRAFPAPKGAQVFDQSMNFTIITTEGWTWSSTDGKEAFEAATREGKVVGLALTKQGSLEAKNLAASIAQLGQPTRKAEGKSAALYVWESGANVRFLLNSIGPAAILGNMNIILIGSKEDLKLLNYRADDPATMVKQFDLAADQRKSGKLNPIFEEAKRKAIEKRKKG